MKASLEQGSLRDGLKHAQSMLGEMKTSALSPRNYFNLYMLVFDELAQLESHFVEEQRNGRRMKDLYESVQYASGVVPRLYLLITVGSVYAKSNEAPVNLILTDLLDMVKGV